MSRRSIEDLKEELLRIRDTKIKEKKLFVSLDSERYNRFMAAIVLTNNKTESLEETYLNIFNKIIDDFINSVDFFDLTSQDIEVIAELFDDIV